MKWPATKLKTTMPQNRERTTHSGIPPVIFQSSINPARRRRLIASPMTNFGMSATRIERITITPHFVEGLFLGISMLILKTHAGSGIIKGVDSGCHK
jgi:hypothetical protein